MNLYSGFIKLFFLISFLGFLLLYLLLSLFPVLLGISFTISLLFINFVGPISNILLHIYVSLCFYRIENLIGEQFNSVVYEEPNQGVSPYKACPTPAKRSHKYSINSYQGCYSLSAKYGYP